MVVKTVLPDHALAALSKRGYASRVPVGEIVFICADDFIASGVPARCGEVGIDVWKEVVDVVDEGPGEIRLRGE